MLLVEGNCQDWRHAEEQRPEEVVVVVVESLACDSQLICVELGGVTADIRRGHVVRHDEVHHSPFGEPEVVPIPVGLVPEQLQHLLLRQWREEKPELDFMVSIGRGKQCVELAVRHDGEAATVIEVARLGLELLYRSAYPPVVDHSAFELGKIGW